MKNEDIRKKFDSHLDLDNAILYFNESQRLEYEGQFKRPKAIVWANDCYYEYRNNEYYRTGYTRGFDRELHIYLSGIDFRDKEIEKLIKLNKQLEINMKKVSDGTTHIVENRDKKIKKLKNVVKNMENCYNCINYNYYDTPCETCEYRESKPLMTDNWKIRRKHEAI